MNKYIIFIIRPLKNKNIHKQSTYKTQWYYKFQIPNFITTIDNFMIFMAVQILLPTFWYFKF